MSTAKHSLLLSLLLASSLAPSVCAAAPGPWDLSGATYENKSFSISAQAPGSQDIFFKSDGSKMYILDFNNPTIRQYSLSTPWNVSTASYDNVSTTTTGQLSNVRGLYFKPDGTKAYVTSETSDAVFQYSLGTAWNIATLSYDNVSTSTAGQTTYATDVEFKTDGTKMYVADFIDHRIYQYSLSSAWDISTASYISRSSAPAQDTTPEDASFSSDGTKLFINGRQNSRVYQYTLSTPWDVTTATYDSINISISAEGSVQGMYFKPDGNQLYLASVGNDIVYQYILTPNATPPTATVTAPADGASVRGTAVTVSATASDDVLVSGVKFYINGTLQGSEDITSPYSITWNTTATTSGSKSIVAVARDSSFNYGTSTPITVTVDNTAPTISAIATSSLTSSGVTVTWTTNENADSQINYGLTSSYGATTTLDAASVTSHSHAISGLTGGTLYHFRVRSTDAAGNATTSANQTFTTLTSDADMPVVSLTSPTSGASISGSSIGLAATATDNTAVVGVKFYVNGVLVGSEDTSSPYTQTWNSTATSSGSRSIVAVARDAAGNQATSSPVTVTLANYPTPTGVTVSTATTTARATWTTPTSGSSRMFFGLISATGSSTPETNTSSKVTSHTVDLSSLPGCTVYKYLTVSKNDAEDIATSTQSNFKTAGCTGGATILANGESAITTDLGGTLTEGSLSLSVPVSFTASSSAATFQASKLDGSIFFASAGTPTGKTRSGDTVYHLAAIADESTSISTFTSPISVTLSYTSEDIEGIDESSLAIHRYDDSAWNALSSCSVNTSAKTVTCTTTQFSDFALFGDESVTSTRSKTSSVSRRVKSLVSTGNVVEAQELIQKWPSLFASSTPSTVNSVFSRTLRATETHADVQKLQQFLNSRGQLVATTGVGSPGQESNYFGVKTQLALKNFQEEHAIHILKPIGLVKGTGLFGDATRAYVNSLLSTP